MKKKTSLLSGIVLTFVLLFFGCTQHGPDPLVGEWTGTDHSGQSAALIFNADMSAKFLQGNLVLDGSSVGGNVTWRIDKTKNPFHLDLVMRKATGETNTLPMIVRFISDKRIQVKMSDDMKSRPLAFSEAEDINQIVLEKR